MLKHYNHHLPLRPVLERYGLRELDHAASIIYGLQYAKHVLRFGNMRVLRMVLV